jgi:site-specific DNA-methyltransferase (adenine-specific)
MHWRTGIVLDPFAGSGTTLDAAQAVGRHAIGFDLDDRNADLARERVGMFLEIVA